MSQPNEETNRKPRDRQGQLTPDPATAERDAKAAELRKRGMSYPQIAAQLGCAVSTAHAAVERAMTAVRREAAEGLIELELARLDDMYRAALKVLESHHLVVSHGHVVDIDGIPLEDQAPILAAIDRMVKVSESRRKLLGLDQPAKTQLSGALTYQVVGISPEDLT